MFNSGENPQLRIKFSTQEKGFNSKEISQLRRKLPTQEKDIGKKKVKGNSDM